MRIFSTAINMLCFLVIAILFIFSISDPVNKHSNVATEATEATGPDVISGYIKPKGITKLSDMQIGQTIKTCAFHFYHGKMFLLGTMSGDGGACAGVRRDPDGYVGILDKNKSGVWMDSESIFVTDTPVVRIEYVDRLEDVK